MRAASLLPQLLLLLACIAISNTLKDDVTTIPENETHLLANGTILLGANAVLVGNDTIVDGNRTIVIGDDVVTETDEGGEPIVRKKRTFGDIVFRGLADVLGYSVQPKATVFPPPLDPVPGIDIPLQAAAPAPAPPPCGAPRATAPPPCRAQRPPAPAPPRPPPPTKPPPCARPRAVPPPRPRPPPPPPPPRPPPPPPCARPRANPTTPAPCAPAPAPAPKADGVDVVQSNLQLSININRNRPTQAPFAEQAFQEEAAPIAIEPRPARLPAPQQITNPRSVFVDAFVVRNGVTQRVNTLDAAQYDPQQFAGDDDYIAYDDEDESQQADDDDYEDVQESRQNSDKAVRDAVVRFWDKKKNTKKQPTSHYKNVHFGDRNLANVLKRRSDKSQSLQSERVHPNRIPIPIPTEADDDFEVTTTTEDPRKPLRPRVLPPTENNPNQIDTVTVRVPPIYKEKNPKKYHRGPQKPDRDEEEFDETSNSNENNGDGDDSEGEITSPAAQSQVRKRKVVRRKQSRRARSTKNKNETSKPNSDIVTEDDTYGDYDFFSPQSDEEKQFFSQLKLPEPTKDPDLARIEEEPNFFLDDHERLQEDPERAGEDERLDDNGRADDSGRSDERERLTVDTERTDEKQRADPRERTDQLSPNAKVRETGFQNNYVRATNVRVEDPRPHPITAKKTLQRG